MKTKVIILGQEPKKEKKLKPIEFEGCLMKTCKDFNYDGHISEPKDFDVIELITTGLYKDVMFAYKNGDRNQGIVYFGKFNDGVVE